MTPQEKSDFLSSFGNAFELDDQSIRQWSSVDELQVIVEKPSVEDYIRKVSIPSKQNVTKSYSWSGARSIRNDSDFLKCKSNCRNSSENLKERLSYLMPYSHKIGTDDVLPSLQLNRSRCYSMPFIKSSLVMGEQLNIFDGGNGIAAKETRMCVEKDSPNSSLLKMSIPTVQGE